MDSTPIFFQFPDKKAALLAMDTLHEIGFAAEMLEQRHPEHKPALQVHVVNGDLTSALEIAQAHGGRLCETADILEPEVYTNSDAGEFDPSGDDYDRFSAGVHL